jgi:hypothetical protein
VLGDVSSPIEVDLDHVEKEEVSAGFRHYFVRSPGRAWAQVVVDFLSGGEKTVLLKAAADLDVALTGIEPPQGSLLRVRKGKGATRDPEFEVPIGDLSPVAIESLATGVHTVSVDVVQGDQASEIRLASAEVELQAGTRNEVSLELRQPPAPTRVALEGILVLPAEWGVSEFRLSAFLVKPDTGSDRSAGLTSEQMQRESPTSDSWRFSFPAVRPGLVELTVYPMNWSVRVQVGDRGSRDVRIGVPKPARVSLRIVDSESGQDATIDAVQWIVRQSEEAHQNATQWAKCGARPGQFEFTAPSGVLSVSSEDERYGTFLKTLVIEPGPNEVSMIEVARACGFVLRVEDNGSTKWVDELSVHAGCLDGKGEWTKYSEQLDGKRFTVTSPGRYRLTIDDLNGYVRVPAREIVVEPGKFVDVLISLQRKP